MHADEGLLDEVLGAFPVADRAIDEVEQARLVAIHQRVESARLTGQVFRHQGAIIKRLKVDKRAELGSSVRWRERRFP